MSRAPRSAWARRDWGSDDSATPILHVDMDAFYASVEILDRPELAGRPIAVGGKERGVVAAASYEARAYGVNSAMPVGLAYRRCPHLLMLAPRMERYAEVSRQIMAILGEMTPLVEQVSVDEAFLDVSGVRRLFGSPVQIATTIRQRIRAEAGVPSSVGIAATKHVAKIASAHAKPDGMLLVPEAATLDFLHGLPVGALWGVGDKTRERLERRGIATVGDVAALDEDVLARMVGTASAAHLHALASGVDPRPVVTERHEKTIGAEDTFFDCLRSRSEVARALLAQCDDTARRLRKAGLASANVTIKVRFADFTTITRSMTLDSATDVAKELHAAAMRLMDKVDIPETGIRLVGVRAGQLVGASGGVQLAFDTDSRRSDAESAMDEIRERFGRMALGPATLLEAEGRRGLRAPEARGVRDAKGGADEGGTGGADGSPVHA